MAIVAPRIIAPDSSHWAKWLDVMRSPDPDRRQRATGLHARLLGRGRVPLLSQHHLEELLGVEDDATARARVAALRSLPLVGWLRLHRDDAGLGSVVAAHSAPRSATLRASKYLGRAIWRRWSGYHRRSRVETKMHCVKLLDQRLMARDFDRQVVELQVRIAVLNGYTASAYLSQSCGIRTYGEWRIPAIS